MKSLKERIENYKKDYHSDSYLLLIGIYIGTLIYFELLKIRPITLFSILVIFNVLDIYSTNRVVVKTRKADELNPLAKFFMKKLKNKWWIPMFTIAIILFGGLIYSGVKSNDVSTILIFIGVYSMVIWNNFSHIIKENYLKKYKLNVEFK